MSPVKKRVNRILIIAAALTLAAAVGVTFAFMFKKAKSENLLVPASISCTVHEKLDGTEHTDGTNIGGRKNDITVENTSNTSAFVRLRVVSNWVNADGEIMGISSEIPSLTLNDNWLKGSDDTYYFALPLAPGEYTESLCEPFHLSQSTDRDGNVIYQNVELFAEAIQASPTGAAVQSWGVIINDGKITTAP